MIFKEKRQSKSLASSPFSSPPRKSSTEIMSTMMNTLRKPDKRSSFANKVEENRLKKSKMSSNLFNKLSEAIGNKALLENNAVD